MKKLLTFLMLTVSFPVFASDIWGEHIDGVIDRLSVQPNEKIIALTFDLCGGKNGSSLDTKLVKYLQDNNIKATIFISGKFIKKNEKSFLALSKNKNFDIQNHGFWHRPASVTGKSIYGMKGFDSKNKLIQDTKADEEYIYKLTKKRTILYRSGSAYYEGDAIPVINNLGYQVIGFSINGDFGATASVKIIEKNISAAKSGDIIINHLNHPESHVREGVIKAIETLKKQNFKFVFVKDYINK